jgi:hypothetical protein
MLTRRAALLSGAAASLAGSSLARPRRSGPAPGDFVSVEGGRFRLADRPYHFAGANMW